MKKFIAMLLAVSMVLTLAPITGLAEYSGVELWNLQDLATGEKPSGTDFSKNADRGKIDISVEEGKGILSTSGVAEKALKYSIADTNNGSALNANGQTQTLTVTAGKFDESITTDASHVLWVYVKAETAANSGILIQPIGQNFTTGSASTNYFYSIVEDEDGNAVSRKINVGSAALDNGIGSEYHDGAKTIARFLLDKNAEGWIGVPTIGTNVADKALSKWGFFFRAGAKEGFKTPVSKDDAIYFDGFWYTGNTEIPNLNDYQLLNIKSVAVKTAPTKTAYAINDTIDATDGVLTITYGNGTTKDVAMTTAMLSGFDSSAAGSKTITASYAGLTAGTFDVTVEDVTVSSIEIKTAPKTAYICGESFDVTGGKITVNYSDASSEEKDITADMVTFDPLKTGSQDAVITYNGKTATLAVTVTAKQALIWDPENEEDGAAFATNSKEGSNNDVSIGESSNMGIAGKSALQIGIKKVLATSNRTNNVQLNSNAPATMNKTQVMLNGDILWFYVAVEDTATCKDLVCRVNYTDGSAIVNGLLTGSTLYSIKADKDGKPVICDAADNGFKIINHSDPQKRIGFNETKMAGWVGIPVNSLGTKTENIGGHVGHNLEWIDFWRADPSKKFTTSDKVYIDEIWLTSAGTMPNLTDAELLYEEVPVSVAVTAPTKLEYNLNETLDVTGGKVTATYASGYVVEKALTADMVSGFDSTTAGTKNLTVTYKGVAAATGFSVEVAAAYITDIELKDAPKLEYFLNESLDLTGGVIVANFSDASTTDVNLTADMIAGFDSSTAGTKTLTVTYLEKTTSFDVTVKVRQELLWDVEGETVGPIVFEEGETEDIVVATTAKRGVQTASITEIGGVTTNNNEVKGSKALTYTITSPSTKDDSNFQTNTLSISRGKLNSIKPFLGDILWIRVSANLSHVARLLVQATVSSAVNFDATNGFYTILDDGEGKAVISNLALPEAGVAGELAANGIGLERHSGTTGGILLDKDAAGWIGIPCAGSAIEGKTITKLGMFLRKCFADATALPANDSVSFDEFWITSAGTMPGLTDAELLYTGAPAAALDQINVNIGGDLKFNAYVKGFEEGMKVRFTLDGKDPAVVTAHETVTVESADFECFSFEGLSAIDIQKNIKVELLDADDKVLDDNTADGCINSILSYINAARELVGGQDLITLCCAMLDYDAALAAYLGTEPFDPSSEEWYTAVTPAEKPEGVKKVTVPTADPENVIVSAALHLYALTDIYFYVNWDGTSEITVSLTRKSGDAQAVNVISDTMANLVADGKAVKVIGNMYVIASDPIAADSFNDVYTLGLAKGGETISEVTYSVASYLGAKWGDGTDVLGKLCRAFAAFGEASEAYKK